MNDEYKFSGDTLSYWTQVGSFQPSSSKMVSARLDVVIIGTGIAGLSAGYLLTKEGRQVTLIDAGPLCAGQTSRTTAHLSFAMDDGIAELIEYHGKEKTALFVDSHRRAVDKIEEIVNELRIDCDFTRLDGFLFLKPGHSIRYLNDQLHACHGIGMLDVELQNYLPAFKAGACLRFPNQAQFHPLKYCFALASAIENQGGRILLRQRVKDIHDGTPVVVKLENGEELQASQVIVATNTPIHERFAIHTKQAPYRTYVVAAAIPKDSIPKALYWDTEDPYHYIRIVPGKVDEDLLIVGGEDHKTGQEEHPAARFERLERWARTRFSQIKGFKYRWSGQVYEPIDMVAFIGRSPGMRNVFLATGDSGQGMTHGTVAGMLLTDLLQERENPWTEIYDPSRLPLSGGIEFFRENANVVWQYADYLRPSELDGVDQIPLCEGAVLRRGTKPIAVYKNMNGKVIQRSAICPHLGCIVHWNSVEKTWDCPCHGSRFHVDGQVITGPAVDPLSPVDPFPPEAHNPPRG